MTKKGILSKVITVILAIALIASVALNIYLYIDNKKTNDVVKELAKPTANRSYLEYPDQVYIMEAGILKQNMFFDKGTDVTFSYDFNNPDYQKLLDQYNIKAIAGEGTELERALRLMNEFAPRLTHKSDYKNEIDIKALPLLEYSLNKPDNGINCRNKAQILNEMCLALNIYSRKVWIMPNSPYDTDCHVVNEVWDTTLEKWVMLDITNNQYWVDQGKTPLSILEIRSYGATQEFCTPVMPNDDQSNLLALNERYKPSFLYIMKNMLYTRYCKSYGVGEEDVPYILYPENLYTTKGTIISQSSVTNPPMV